MTGDRRRPSTVQNHCVRPGKTPRSRALPTGLTPAFSFHYCLVCDHIWGAVPPKVCEAAGLPDVRRERATPAAIATAFTSSLPGIVFAQVTALELISPGSSIEPFNGCQAPSCTASGGEAVGPAAISWQSGQHVRAADALVSDRLSCAWRTGAAAVGQGIRRRCAGTAPGRITALCPWPLTGLPLQPLRVRRAGSRR